MMPRSLIVYARTSEKIDLLENLMLMFFRQKGMPRKVVCSGAKNSDKDPQLPIFYRQSCECCII
jgi:hypothetical protein